MSPANLSTLSRPGCRRSALWSGWPIPLPLCPRNKAGLTLGILIAAVLAPIGIGALIGLGTGMAHWIAHLFA